MKLGDNMRIVNKTYQVYSFQELDESIREKLISNYDNYDPNLFDHILDEEQGYLGFQATVISFDLDCKDLEVKDLRTDLDMMQDSYRKRYFSKSLTKKEYKALSSELRLIPYLYVDVISLYRADSTVEISDEFSCHHNNMNVNHNRLESFFEDIYIDFKHLILKDLQDTYTWAHSEAVAVEDLQEYKYLEDGTVFYE
jgi:hypothetical protein